MEKAFRTAEVRKASYIAASLHIVTHSTHFH